MVSPHTVHSLLGKVLLLPRNEVVRGSAAGGLFTSTRISHQGRDRVRCDAVRWQGVTTLRAHAREKEQLRQRAAARRNRVRSAQTKLDLVLEAE